MEEGFAIACLGRKAGRMWDKKNFCYSLPRKKIGLPYGNLRILRLTTVENKSISSGNFANFVNTNFKK